jgi:hypothetical protein
LGRGQAERGSEYNDCDRNEYRGREWIYESFVCGFTFSMTGTTPTFQFKYGTGAACTSLVVLTGAFQADITASIVNICMMTEK